ncbi:uncharacterized protein LOC115745362 isoform X2 [Rhodamnia argentea]|uniref:Uncharacterized protein LOC115745362 isoform X2 n=1 Tax=Rhodamnia argentea TaxID=178133 RepID=A0ABM3HTY4_9MYRT|nr:uncharacterized protein LOC115745362 isoform X2 [Rhodamnia argentea]
MMNESAGKAAPCLAITEKRQAPTRPGGCVGIFCQLFDWHRRFAKKKLFSRKLLPPARAKQVSRNFHRDEKMPAARLHLIADENKGGFPNSRRNGNKNLDLEQRQKHETQAPGLVARLMGLESMPAAQKKVTRPLSCDTRHGKVQKFLLGSEGSAEEDDLDIEKGQLKHELRPQKLQKTGPLERRVVTRFGVEALQIKGVLTKSRKQHHPKLLPPVKSPRISSIQNTSRTSRLIDAAARILEPGLQARSRVKCALPYSISGYPSSEVGIAERSPSQSQNAFTQAICSEAEAAGQTSCIDCGNLVDIDLRQNTSQQMLNHVTITLNPFHASYQDSRINEPRPPAAAVMEERDVTYRRRQRESVAPCSPPNCHFQVFNVPLKDAKPLPKECQEQRCMPSHGCNPHQEESPSNALKNSPTTEKEMLETGRTTPTAKCINSNGRKALLSGNSATGAKDFVALNRSLSGQTRPRVPVKAENSGSDAARKTRVRRADSLSQFRSPVRKIRSANVDGLVESPSFVSSEVSKQNNAQHNAVPKTKVNFRASSSDRSCDSNKLVGEADRIKAGGSNNNSVVSFTFNSPLKHRSGFPEGIGSKRTEKSLPGGKVSDSREPLFNRSDDKAAFQKQFPWNGDALGALLDCKLKELISQEEDELSTACAMPKRSTAMILQELIAALTAAPPLSQDCHMLDAGNAIKKAKKEGTLIGFSSDVNHLSPGSVLDASFSNDSCISSSLDECTGLKLHPDFMDYPDPLQPLNLEAYLLDSATSLDNRRSYPDHLIDRITRLIGDLDLVVLGLDGSRLAHAKDVILHAELLFTDLTRRHSDGMKDFMITLFLLDELERAAATTWTDMKSFFGSKEAKEGNQLRRFLFHCLLECLDSKYRRYCNFGYQGWTRQSMFLNIGNLIRDVGGEVREWACIAGMTPDEIIDYEMSHALGKWTDFDIEAFENGAELGEDILSNLVEEILIEL